MHLVFGTKDRAPFLAAEIRGELLAYATGTLKNIGCPVVQIGGTADHVHVLFDISRTLSLSQVVEKVKTSSSKWIKGKGERYVRFAWQAGYGAFSVGPAVVAAVVRYIRGQEEHHRSNTFQDEFRRLCREAGVELDERYVWD